MSFIVFPKHFELIYTTFTNQMSPLHFVTHTIHASYINLWPIKCCALNIFQLATSLTHRLLCHLYLPRVSLGLGSTSDAITFDHNWHQLHSTSAGGKDLSNDQSDQLNEAWNMHVNTQKFEWKTQSKISCHYMWLIHGKSCPSPWCFFGSFWMVRKPSRRSIAAAKSEEKEKKGRQKD